MKLRALGWKRWLWMIGMGLLGTLGWGGAGAGDLRLHTENKEEEGKTYALLVATDSFADKRTNRFQYAEKDLGAIKRLLMQTIGLWKSDLLVLTGRAATKAGLLGALKQFGRTLQKKDRLLFFFSGDLVVKEGEAFLRMYDTQTEDIARTGISAEEFGRQVRRWKTSQALVMLDACHSGAFLGPWLLLASSKRDQLSFEEARLQHGLFTYALLEALQGKADLDTDGEITLIEVFGYLSKRLPSLATRYRNNIQTPVLACVFSEPFVIRNQAKAKPSKTKPRPRPSNSRDRGIGWGK